MSFRQDLELETIASLELREAIIVNPYTVVRAAVAAMRYRSLGCAVIVDYHRRPAGIFTERSVIDALTKDASLDDSVVYEFADPSFIQAKVTDPIARVWQAVQEAAARFVCVTDTKNNVVGITGQRGLAEYLADCFARQVTVQRLGSTPWMRQREGA